MRCSSLVFLALLGCQEVSGLSEFLPPGEGEAVGVGSAGGTVTTTSGATGPGGGAPPRVTITSEEIPCLQPILPKNQADFQVPSPAFSEIVVNGKITLPDALSLEVYAGTGDRSAGVLGTEVLDFRDCGVLAKFERLPEGAVGVAYFLSLQALDGEIGIGMIDGVMQGFVRDDSELVETTGPLTIAEDFFGMVAIVDDELIEWWTAGPEATMWTLVAQLPVPDPIDPAKMRVRMGLKASNQFSSDVSGRFDNFNLPE